MKCPSCGADVMHRPYPHQPASALRVARKRAGLTQAALAALVGVTPAAIAAMEAGRIVPTLARASRIAHALGTDVSSLFPFHD